MLLSGRKPGMSRGLREKGTWVGAWVQEVFTETHTFPGHGDVTEDCRPEGGAIRKSWMCLLYSSQLGNTVQKYSIIFFFMTPFSEFCSA